MAQSLTSLSYQRADCNKEGGTTISKFNFGKFDVVIASSEKGPLPPERVAFIRLSFALTPAAAPAAEKASLAAAAPEKRAVSKKAPVPSERPGDTYNPFLWPF